MIIPARFLLCCAWLLCIPFATAQFSLGDIVFEEVASGVVSPTSIKNAGDGSGRLFFTTQDGLVLVYDGQELLDVPFLDLREKAECVRKCGERGLLDIEFHPNFPANNVFFVNYTDTNGDTVVSRFEVSENPNRAGAGSEEIILRIGQPQSNHNGGQLQFGPDGFLYIASGDGGGVGDPDNNAQSLQTLLGKILRIDVDGGSPYAIPASNPFAGRGNALGEIWAYGLRNPWRFSFDRETGGMYIGDVGQGGREEVNFQPADSSGGENYGWRIMEGNACFDTGTNRPVNPPETCNDGSLVQPFFDYPHEGSDCGGSVTGGYVYRGSRFPAMQGHYFFADFCSGRLWAAIREGNGEWNVLGPLDTGFRITTFGEDEDGELYLADISSKGTSSGTIYRLTTGRPEPGLTRVSPVRAAAGGAGFEMTVFGEGFVGDSELRWDGSARPTTFVDNSILRASIPVADLEAAGTAELTVFTPPPGGGGSAPLEFEVAEPPSLSPRINPGGAVNAASFAGGEPLSPGSIFSVFGMEIAAWDELTGGAPLPTSLGGAALWFEPVGPAALGSGSRPQASRFAAPLFFAGAEEEAAGQFNAQVPWELEGAAEARLSVQVGEQVSDAIIVPLAAHAPGLFSFDLSGSGQAAFAIANTHGVLPAPENFRPDVNSRPVGRREFIEMFATGLGPVDNTPPSGNATVNPIPQTIEQPEVTVGGVPQEVTFSGLAPGFVGLYQVNIRIQEETPGGDAVPVVLTIGGVESNTVTIAVEGE